MKVDYSTDPKWKNLHFITKIYLFRVFAQNGNQIGPHAKEAGFADMLRYNNCFFNTETGQFAALLISTQRQGCKHEDIIVEGRWHSFGYRTVAEGKPIRLLKTDSWPTEMLGDPAHWISYERAPRGLDDLMRQTLAEMIR